MKRITRRPTLKFKSRSLRQLVRLALRGWGSERSWQAIGEMQMRGAPSTQALAKALSSSPNWRRRALGLYIASQLRRRHRGTEHTLAETQGLLLQALHDPHREVVRAAVSGLGHWPHPAALAELVRLSTHPHPLLRWDVAVALSRYSDPMAIEALLHLATDSHHGVRDWATFGVGTLQDTVDSPAIRDVLWHNLHDANADVRGEALMGLANRHDPRAVEHLVRHLDADCRVYELEAAERLASPMLAPALRQIADQVARDGREAGSYWLGRLRDAMAACTPNPAL